jgi:hypothetical protein
MEGLPEALYRMAMLAVAASTALGVIVSASTVVFHPRTTWLSELLIGAVCISAVAGLSAARDVLDLGGNLPWRVVVFSATLAGATLVSRAVIRSHGASHDRPSAVALIVRGTAAFTVTAAVLFIGLVTVSLILS